MSNLTVRRMRELGEEISTLQTQQHLLGKMLQVQSRGELPVTIDKQAWIEMLRAAGMDEAAMRRWHAKFERRAPEAHHQFLRIRQPEPILPAPPDIAKLTSSTMRRLHDVNTQPRMVS